MSFSYITTSMSLPTVNFVNISQEAIGSIEIQMSTCGAKLSQSDDSPNGVRYKIVLYGPFSPNTVYQSNVHKIEEVDLKTGDVLDKDVDAKKFGHAVLKDIKIEFANGKELDQSNNFREILAPKLANYCLPYYFGPKLFQP